MRTLKHSSTSFDSGFVTIKIDNNQRADLEWNWDPFRKPKPKWQPWKKTIQIKPALTVQIFKAIDQIDFDIIEKPREQIPDEPSVTFTELRNGNVLHSVTHPASEVAPSLLKVYSLIETLYNQNKSSR